MALFINLDENRTEIQKKIETELQEKARRKTELTDSPDGVEDSQYVKNTKKTTSLAWVWALIIIFIVGLIIWLMANGIARK